MPRGTKGLASCLKGVPKPSVCVGYYSGLYQAQNMHLNGRGSIEPLRSLVNAIHEADHLVLVRTPYLVPFIIQPSIPFRVPELNLDLASATKLQTSISILEFRNNIFISQNLDIGSPLHHRHNAPHFIHRRRSRHRPRRFRCRSN